MVVLFVLVVGCLLDAFRLDGDLICPNLFVLIYCWLLCLIVLHTFY